MKEDSLRKRYIFKLSTNLVGLPVSLVTQAIVPRLLGPIAYGSYNFLTTYFISIFGFFDFGTSNALYTKLSQRPKEHKLLHFFLLLTIAIVFLVFLFVFASDLMNITSFLWPEQGFRFVLLAMVWGALFWAATLVSKVIDACGLTVRGEIIKMIQKVLGLVLVCGMFFMNYQGLDEFFVLQFILLLFVVVGGVRLLSGHGVSLYERNSLTLDDAKGYSRELYVYSSPLVVSSLFVLISSVFDRWFLQNYAGSLQQGFYGFSNQISMICFIFTSAMSPLFMREVSISHGAKDSIRLRALFNKFVPLLYGIAVYFSMFLAFRGESLIYIMGGRKFEEATISVAIMSLYPIHQSYGQLNEAVMLATGQTKAYRRFSIITVLLGIPMTVILVGPSSVFGLHLGAFGLAIKMVALQIIAVNMELLFNSRYLKLSFLRFFFQQITVFGVFALMSFLTRVAIESFVYQRILSFFLEGILYTSMSLAVAMMFSESLFSVNRSELRTLIDKLRRGILKR